MSVGGMDILAFFRTQVYEKKGMFDHSLKVKERQFKYTRIIVKSDRIINQSDRIINLLF
jgi:hypothetical protein